METREDILKELREIAPHLAALNKTNVYSVPEGYFVDFKRQMLNKIALTDAQTELETIAPELAALDRTNTAQVPATYFKGFSEKLITQIRAKEVADELSQIAPALAAMQKVNAIEVPADYFATFAQGMLQQVQVKPKPKPVTWPLLQSFEAIATQITAVIFKPKYSAAFAGLATIVIVAGMLLMHVQQQCDDLDCRMAKLSNDEIGAYLDNKTDAYDDEVFESGFSEGMLTPTEKANATRQYKDALNDLDDAALERAINNN